MVTILSVVLGVMLMIGGQKEAEPGHRGRDRSRDRSGYRGGDLRDRH